MGFLSRIFSRNLPQLIEHPVLGEARLIGAKQGSYWEVETELATKPFTLIVETVNGEEPSAPQVEFFLRYARDPDAAFDKAAEILVPNFERWLREPFPLSWRDAFEFTAMTVPADADENSAWELSFACLKDRAGHVFTCEFEGGAPKTVIIDG